MFSHFAGNQRYGDPGAHPQCTGSYDGDPADLPHVAWQQQPLHEAQPQDLLAAVWPAGRIPAEPGGKVASRGRFACSSPGLKEFDWKFKRLTCWTHHITHRCWDRNVVKNKLFINKMLYEGWVHFLIGEATLGCKVWQRGLNRSRCWIECFGGTPHRRRKKYIMGYNWQWT